MAYESPIKLITDLEHRIIEDQERNIYKAVVSYGIDIDKDELFKLLFADRNQYEKGYADGLADAIKHGHWEKLAEADADGNVWYSCSICNRGDLHAEEAVVPYCWYCGAKMDEVEE